MFPKIKFIGLIWIRSLDCNNIKPLIFCVRAGIDRQDLDKFTTFLTKLAAVYRQYDCQTLEINPLVVTEQEDIVCADCKMEIDNSAVSRHPEFGIKIARDFPGEITELDEIGWSIEETDARGTGF